MSFWAGQLLREAGWHTGEYFDTCWLDCAKPGYLLISGNRVICLCPEHALVLEQGRWDGDYTGAPLPPESRATEWPWQKRNMPVSAA